VSEVRFIGVVLLAVIPLVAYEATAEMSGRFDSAFWSLSLSDKLPRIAAQTRRWLRFSRTWMIIPVIPAIGFLVAAVAGLGVSAWIWLGVGLAVVTAPPTILMFAIQGKGMANAAEGGGVPGWLEGLWPVLYDLERMYVVAMSLASFMIGLGLLDGLVLDHWVAWAMMIGPGLVAVVAVGTDFFFPHMALLGPVILGVAMLIA
jgi:hypothetical protein